MAERGERPASYREVFAVREFRTLFAADLCSLFGDQVAAVALAVLLYSRSGSALLAALGYATAYVPWLIGGPVLAAWAERLPGRSVLVGCDLLRAVLIGVAAVPGVPLPVVGLLVLAASVLAPPFDAARSALLPVVLTGDRYQVAMSLRDAVHQGAQLVGFVAGGTLVAVLGAHGALFLDAVTFAASSLLILRGLRHRPAVRSRSGGSLARDLADGWRTIRRDRLLSGCLALGVVGAAYAIVPEAIAVAYAASLGRGAPTVGLIMAAAAGGSVLGGLAIGRLAGPALRVRLVYPLALAGALPLVLVVLRPGLPLSLLLFGVTGLAGAFQVVANSLFSQNVPAGLRARAFSLASAAMYAGQSLAIVLAGAAATVFPPFAVVAGAGLAGALAVLALRGSGRAVGRALGRPGIAAPEAPAS